MNSQITVFLLYVLLLYYSDGSAFWKYVTTTNGFAKVHTTPLRCVKLCVCVCACAIDHAISLEEKHKKRSINAKAFEKIRILYLIPKRSLVDPTPEFFFFFFSFSDSLMNSPQPKPPAVVFVLYLGRA